MRPAAFVRGVVARLTGVGLARTAAALSYATVLSLVPLFTVALVYVARYPLFQQWLDALERFLLRHLLPGSESVVPLSPPRPPCASGATSSPPHTPRTHAWPLGQTGADSSQGTPGANRGA